MLLRTEQYQKSMHDTSLFLTNNYLGKYCRVKFLFDDVEEIFISNTAEWLNGFSGEIDRDGTEHYFFDNEIIKSIEVIDDA